MFSYKSNVHSVTGEYIGKSVGLQIYDNHYAVYFRCLVIIVKNGYLLPLI